MEYKFIPYAIPELSESEQAKKAADFNAFMSKRRTVRTFSDKPVSKEVIENILMAASSAPSGANKQPWHFCAISSSKIKKEIRIAAEKEEYLSYTERMSDEWKADLEKLRTNWEKPFLEKAPWLIVVFMQNYEILEHKKKLNYYVKESVGLATGMLLAAAFNAGLASLTYTPSPMRFLGEILGRPRNEKPYLLVPLGFPEKDTTVPDIERKGAEDVITYYS